MLFGLHYYTWGYIFLINFGKKGFYMDIQQKAYSLLGALANSIHDNDSSSNFFFTLNEKQVAEKWLLDFIEELKSQLEMRPSGLSTSGS